MRLAPTYIYLYSYFFLFLFKKKPLLESDIKEIGERNELLLREMKRFDKLTRNIQKLVSDESSQNRKFKESLLLRENIAASIYGNHWTLKRWPTLKIFH